MGKDSKWDQLLYEEHRRLRGKEIESEERCRTVGKDRNEDEFWRDMEAAETAFTSTHEFSGQVWISCDGAVGPNPDGNLRMDQAQPRQESKRAREVDPDEKAMRKLKQKTRNREAAIQARLKTAAYKTNLERQAAQLEADNKEPRPTHELLERKLTLSLVHSTAGHAVATPRQESKRARDPDEVAMLKLNRVISNRESAYQSRLKETAYMTNLELQAAQLEADNKELRRKHELLERRLTLSLEYSTAGHAVATEHAVKKLKRRNSSPF